MILEKCQHNGNQLKPSTVTVTVTVINDIKS